SFTAPSSITLSGSWLKTAGTFVHNSGTVTLDGGNQTVSGSTVFFNFSKTTSTPETLTFSKDGTQGFSGALTLYGTDGNLLSIRSTLNGTQAAIRLNGGSASQNIRFVDVRDSNAAGGQSLSCEACVNSGNNVSWDFVSPEIGGTLLDQNGTLPLAGKTVAYALNGGTTLIDTATTDASGNFILSGATMTGGSIITIFVDNNAENAVTVLRSSGSSMTGIILYENHLVIRSESGSAVTSNATLSLAHNADTDITALYSVSSNNLTLSGASSVLLISSGDSFIPGGTVSAHDLNIDGTLTMQSNALTVSGFFDATGGTFTTSALTTFTSSSSETIASGGNSFQNVLFSGIGTYTLTSAMDVNGTFTLQSGTFNQSTSTLTISGNTGIASGSTFTKSSNNSALTLDTTLTLENENDQNLGDLSISGAGTVDITMSGALRTDSLTIGTGDILDTEGLTLSASGSVRLYGLLDARNNGANVSAITLSGSFIASGTGDFLSGTSSVTFDGTSGSHTITSSGAFHNLAFSAAGATYTLTNAQTINGDFTVSNGTVTASSALDLNGDFTQTSGSFTAPSSITLSGSWLKTAGTVVHNSGTVTLDGANQTVSGSTVFFNFSKTTSTPETLTFSKDGSQGFSGALVLQGAFGNVLSIRSTESGVAAPITLAGGSATQNLAFINVQDSDASAGDTLICAFCVDNGNNNNWTFVSHTIGGQLRNQAGSSPLAGRLVSYALNGGATPIDSTVTDASGNFVLSGAYMSGGSIVTLYIDDEAEQGVTVLR
ncbi:MAG: hypothetical protein ABL994_11235, partial [Verrucomicrobiales bacterium]